MVREALAAGDRAVVQALRGMGGVGKTQLAAEYAHRYATGYDIVWWVDAERPELIGGQFAALGAALGCLAPGAGEAEARRAVLGALRGRERWLLVFDNAEDPGHVIPWLPGGAGHVLVTSRTGGWEEVAVPVEVDVMNRGEAVALLRRRAPALDDAGADLVADAVGDLPLGLAQAGAYLAGTGIPAGEYAGLVRDRAAEILDTGRPPSYPLSLAAVTQLAADRLEAGSPAAAQVLRVCAFLAPEPVPAVWFTTAAAQLPPPLGEAAADPLAWGQILARISGQALARVDPQGLLTHRLTQAIIRTRLSPGEAAAAREQAAELLTASHPGHQDLPSTWPGWERLLPHLLALDPDASSPALSDLANDAVWYLIRRGLARNAYDLGRQLYQNRRGQYGPDHPGTLRAARALADGLRGMRRYSDAMALDEDTLTRCRRVLGEDHPGTLATANNLAIDLKELAEYVAARELSEDTLARCRRVLGEDHPSTLATADNLVLDLREVAEYVAARELSEDTLARCRRVLGEDHPSTLNSADSLAVVLWHLREHGAARELDEDTLARRRRVLGEDHPDTLNSANNLAVELRELGDYRAARELDGDTVARRRRVLGEDHPDTLTSVGNLAVDLHGLGEYGAARELDEDTLTRRRSVLGEDHPDTQHTAHNLAADLRALGEIPDGSGS
jgi:hypothetical protein